MIRITKSSRNNQVVSNLLSLRLYGLIIILLFLLIGAFSQIQIISCSHLVVVYKFASSGCWNILIKRPQKGPRVCGIYLCISAYLDNISSKLSATTFSQHGSSLY
jgi:hypothetical protein